MNKELIKTYFEEFKHWLNGGKLQVKFVNDPWEEAPEGIFSYNTVNFVLVIDDEYVEFRKAMAERMKEESLELWKPEEEEYFWYKNDLVKFHKSQTNAGLLPDSARGCSYYPAESNFEGFLRTFYSTITYTHKG